MIVFLWLHHVADGHGDALLMSAFEAVACSSLSSYELATLVFRQATLNKGDRPQRQVQ